MEKIKKWVEQNSEKLIVAGIVVVGGVIIAGTTVLAYRLSAPNSVRIIPKGFSSVRWNTNDPNIVHGIERVREILESTENSSTAFAIIHPGFEKDQYVCLALTMLG